MKQDDYIERKLKLENHLELVNQQIDLTEELRFSIQWLLDDLQEKAELESWYRASQGHSSKVKQNSRQPQQTISNAQSKTS